MIDCSAKVSVTGRCILLVVVCAVVVVVHWPALSSRAVLFDDDQYLRDNLLVRNPSWGSALRFFTEVLEPSTVQGYYQPLTMLSLMADYALGGRSDNFTPFHRTSLVLHTVNTVLVIVLLYLLFGRFLIAAGAGLLFGLHPMTVEPICWVGDRKDLLVFFFALWCLIFYVQFTRSRSWGFYSGCIIMYLLALMSKPTATSLPVLMLLLDYWPLKRLNKRSVLEKLPIFVLAGIFAVITYISQSRAAGIIPPAERGIWHIPLTICHNIIFYLYKILWPANLSSFYAYPRHFGFSSAMVLAGVVGTCVLIPLLVLSLRWTRALLTGWLFFFVAIFPTMGVIGFTVVIAADRYAYLPSIGLLMLLAWFLGLFCSRGKVAARSIAVVTIVLVIAAAESIATRRYLVHWRDTVSVFEHMLTLAPDEAPIHTQLGIALGAQGRLDEAIGHYYRSLELQPDGFITYYNLGYALYLRGDIDGAALNFANALRIKPDYARAHNGLGIALLKAGKPDQAVAHFTEAVRIKPEFPDARKNLADVLLQQGRLEQAAEEYCRVLYLLPDNPEVLNQLGIVFDRQGKLDQAVAQFTRALRIKPDLVDALNNLAWLLALHDDSRIRDPHKAIRLAERACELTGYQQPELLDTLAAAYASAARFSEAVATAQKALELAQSLEQKQLIEDIRNRLRLYKAAKPYIGTADH
jgi:Flp pilus assembly protein TadD